MQNVFFVEYTPIFSLCLESRFLDADNFLIEERSFPEHIKRWLHFIFLHS